MLFLFHCKNYAVAIDVNASSHDGAIGCYIVLFLYRDLSKSSFGVVGWGSTIDCMDADSYPNSIQLSSTSPLHQMHAGGYIMESWLCYSYFIVGNMQ